MSDKQADRLFELFRALEMPSQKDVSKLAERVTAQVREEREKRAAASAPGAGPAPVEETQSRRGGGWLRSLAGLALGILLTAVVVASVMFVFREPIGEWLLASSETPTPTATVVPGIDTPQPSPTAILHTVTPTRTSIPTTDVTPEVIATQPPTTTPLPPAQAEVLEGCAERMELQITCTPVEPELGLVLGQEVACSATANTPTESYWMARYSQFGFLPKSSDGDAELANNAARFSLPFTGEYTVKASVFLPECSESLAVIRTIQVTVASGQSALVTDQDGAKVLISPSNGSDELATIDKDSHLALISDDQDGGNNWKFLPIHWNTEDGQAWLRHLEVALSRFYAAPEASPYCEDLGPGFTDKLPEPREAVITNGAPLYDGCGRIVGKMVHADENAPESATVIAEGADWTWIRIRDSNLFVKPADLQ